MKKHDMSEHDKPVAWLHDDGVLQDIFLAQDGATTCPNCKPLYTHPAQWVGLTKKERSKLWWDTDMRGMPEHVYGKAVEAALKEKNS